MLFFKETNPDGYLTQERALKMWKECLGVDYFPTVDLRKVYYLDENGNKIIKFDDDGEGLKKAVEEASKYITKALDLLSLLEWNILLKYINGVKRMGGSTKNLWNCPRENIRSLKSQCKMREIL